MGTFTLTIEYDDEDQREAAIAAALEYYAHHMRLRIAAKWPPVPDTMRIAIAKGAVRPAETAA